MNERQIDKLLVKTSLGDNEAFEALYEGTKRGVFSFLYSYLKNYAETEDAMQAVYLKVKLNIASYRRGTNGRAWLLQIAKNHALNVLAKNKRAKCEQAETSVFEVDIFGQVSEAMKRALTEEEQRLIILHVLWGYKHREIAEEWGCSVGTVTSKYKRSVEKLKKELVKEEES